MNEEGVNIYEQKYYGITIVHQSVYIKSCMFSSNYTPCNIVLAFVKAKVKTENIS